MSTFIRAIAVLSLVTAVLAASPTEASASHSWGGYHWGRTADPFALRVGNNMSGSWPSYLATAESDWSSTAYNGKTDSWTQKVGGVDTAITVTVANPLALVPVAGTSKGNCRPVSGTVQVCNNTYGNNGWLGLATIWLSSGHIVQGTAKMNDTYFNTSAYSNPNEKQHVVCQEVGHTFGLDHQSTSGADLNTCMDYFSNTGSNATNTDSTHPNLHDYGELTYVYSHVDGSNTYATAATARAAPATATGFAPDGTPLGASPAKGRVYVTVLADGTRVVTWVNWVR